MVVMMMLLIMMLINNDDDGCRDPGPFLPTVQVADFQRSSVSAHAFKGPKDSTTFGAGVQVGVSENRGTFKAILKGFLTGIYKGSIQDLGFRVSENRGTYLGVLIIRILLFRVLC